ncbi:MAG: MFS transporter [Actinomycetota bacterium]|nr:MFS transporter [Actinomycetota bacterium]
MSVQHGVRANLVQHALLATNVAFIGAMVGLERMVVPLLASEVFGVTSATLVLSFIAGFGTTKALANLLSGRLADRLGRRRLLVIGWVAGVPVPFLVMLAPTWGWVVAANLLLGAHQGLTWTMTLAMMGDLAGRRRRGLVMGANEFTGYAAIGVATWLTGQIGATHGLRQAPFWLGAAAALAGLAIALATRDTLPHATTESTASHLDLGRAHRAACYQAGLVTKINDAGVWGLLPLLLGRRGLEVAAIATVAATYPLIWGIGQLVTGGLSDRVGRRPLIVAGMFAQASGLIWLAWTPTFAGAVVAAAILGGGTALSYPPCSPPSATAHATAAAARHSAPTASGVTSASQSAPWVPGRLQTSPASPPPSPSQRPYRCCPACCSPGDCAKPYPHCAPYRSAHDQGGRPNRN